MNYHENNKTFIKETKVKIAIIGFPNSGKSTVFNVLTQSNIETSAYSGGKSTPNIAVVKVPDERVEKLDAIFSPKKKTPAEIVFQDFVGIVKDDGKKKDTLFSEDVKQSDALVHVCRVFEDDAVPHPSDKVDPLSDAETMELELIMSDLMTVDNRIERLQKDLQRKPSKEAEFELELMQRLKVILEEEKPLRDAEITDEELKVIKGYNFLSLKKIIIVANVSEDQLSGEATKGVEEYASKIGVEFQALCGTIEMEIAQMEEEDQLVFLEEYGIENSARDIFIRKAYNMLGLISFFTVGEDEVKAWTIVDGTNAQDAAGEIHSDLKRGFIRAETVAYDAFMEVESLSKAREKGMLRQEGKTYIVKDGDIINIKFNV